MKRRPQRQEFPEDRWILRDGTVIGIGRRNHALVAAQLLGSKWDGDWDAWAQGDETMEDPRDVLMRDFGAIRSAGGCVFELWDLDETAIALIKVNLDPRCVVVSIDFHYPQRTPLLDIDTNLFMSCFTKRDIARSGAVLSLMRRRLV